MPTFLNPITNKEDWDYHGCFIPIVIHPLDLREDQIPLRALLTIQISEQLQYLLAENGGWQAELSATITYAHPKFLFPLICKSE